MLRKWWNFFTVKASAKRKAQNSVRETKLKFASQGNYTLVEILEEAYRK